MKNVIISIKGTQNFIQDPSDTVELGTDGKYTYADGRGELTYMESELTGMEGTKTSFIFPAWDPRAGTCRSIIL